MVQYISILSEWLGVIAVSWILLLSTRFIKRPVKFLYPRREGMVTLSLVALICLLSVLVFGDVLQVPQIPVLSGLEPLGLRMGVAVLSLIPFGAALYLRRQPLLSAGWGKVNRSAVFQLGAGLLIITIFLRGKIPGILNGFTPEEIAALLLCVILAVAEETIWRGYVQLRLSGWWGEMPGWLAAAALSVVWQLPRFLLYPDSILILVLQAVGQALVLGWVAQKSGHTLGVAMYRAVSEWIWYII